MNPAVAPDRQSQPLPFENTRGSASSGSRLPLFATPVAMFDAPGMDEVNRDIAARLIAESRSRPSVRRSNMGSWHSEFNLAKRPEQSFRTLISYIASRVRETAQALASERGQKLPDMRVSAHAWAMVMQNGDYTIPHDHAESHWATVYYPDAGDADLQAHPDSGLIAFIDPRHGTRPMPGLELVGGTFTVKPRTGRLLIFPGWLYHYVHVYRGQRPRISISCNVSFEPPAP